MSTFKQRHDVYQAALRQIVLARTSLWNEHCPWCGWMYGHALGCPVRIAEKALEMGLWSGLSIEKELEKEANS